MSAPFRRLHHTPPLPTPQDPLLAHPDGQPASVQVLEERDGVFPGNPEEVLDVPRADLLPLAEERDDLVLDRVERRGVKVERLLDAHEPLALEEELEELVLVAAAHAGAAEGLLGTRRRRLGLEELLLDAVHDALLLGRQAHPVGREPDLVPLGRDDALGFQGDDERREHPLVGATRAHPQLLARHSRLSGLARWKASSAATASALKRAELSGWRYHSRSTTSTRPCATRRSSRPRSFSGPKGTRPSRVARRAPAGPTWRTCSSTISWGLPVCRRRRCATRAGALRLKRGGSTSRIVPPPIVTIGEYERTTNRSPGSATSGASRRKRAEAVWPGPSSGVSRRRTRAIISLVPTWKRTRVRDLTARGASSRSSSVPSTSSEETSVPARPTTSPRSTAVRSTPWRLIAVRCPANASATGWPCVCT